MLEVFSFYRDRLVEFQWKIHGSQLKDNEKLLLMLLLKNCKFQAPLKERRRRKSAVHIMFPSLIILNPEEGSGDPSKCWFLREWKLRSNKCILFRIFYFSLSLGCLCINSPLWLYICLPLGRKSVGYSARLVLNSPRLEIFL